MNEAGQLTLLQQLLIFISGGVLFVALAFFTSRLIRPHRPSHPKLMAYESGETPLGLARVQFNIRFYILALVFILFEVEIVFLFPWSTILSEPALQSQTEGAWSWYAFTEMLVFIVVLAAGLVYVWKMGHLDWVKSQPQPSAFRSPVPKHLYEALNRRYESIRSPQSNEEK
jgi:NADH-quinone oxidoreductase subunit A